MTTTLLPLVVGIRAPTKALRGDPLGALLMLAWLLPLPLSLVLWRLRRTPRRTVWWTMWTLSAVVTAFGAVLFLLMWSIHLEMEADGMAP